MEIEPFRQMNLLPDIASGAKPPGRVAPRMYRQAMIKDRDNNIYAVYGDRLKKGSPDLGPWDVYIIQPGKLRVAPGLIGGILPSNWNTEFTFDQNELSYMVADCQSDGKVVTAATISNTTEAVTPQTYGLNTAPSSFRILFAVIKDETAVRTVRGGHITINPIIALSHQKTNPTPGLNVVDRYYVWGLL
jgi:hypothetical protein